MTQDSPARERRGRGRPRRENLQSENDALLQAAAEVFLAYGFGGASFERIAIAAGVSPKTIYHRFGGKVGLFAEVMQRIAHRVHSDQNEILIGTEHTPETALVLFLTRLGQTLFSPPFVALQRIVIAETANTPAFGQTLHEIGSRQGIALLARYLAEASACGVLQLDNPTLVAEQLVGAALNESWRRALFGVETNPDITQLEERARYAVETFLLRHQRTAPYPPTSL